MGDDFLCLSQEERYKKSAVQIYPLSPMEMTKKKTATRAAHLLHNASQASCRVKSTIERHFMGWRRHKKLPGQNSIYPGKRTFWIPNHIRMKTNELTRRYASDFTMLRRTIIGWIEKKRPEDYTRINGWISCVVEQLSKAPYVIKCWWNRQEWLSGTLCCYGDNSV